MAGGDAGNEGDTGESRGKVSSNGLAATVDRLLTLRLVRKRIWEDAVLLAKLVILLGVGGIDSSSWNSRTG